MAVRSGLRLVLGLVFSISALAVVAAPAAAETIIKSCVGTCGSYQVDDNGTGMPGVKCSYANSYPYKLKSVSVRPPLIHGNYSNKTKVEWRFKVQRMHIGGGKWLVTYTSPYQSAQASDSIPAYDGHGFSRRSWTAPNNPAGYDYRVVLELQWWHNGSKEGYAKIRYEYYKQQRIGSSSSNLGSYCIPSN